MSKQRRGPHRDPAQRDPAAAHGREPQPDTGALSPDLADALRQGSLTVGHRAGQLPELPLDRSGLESFVGGPHAAATADHAATMLRIAPRDPAWTARLCDRVERSALPAERKSEIALRLGADQATADAVAGAVDRWLGADRAAARSALITALTAGGAGDLATRVAGAAAAVSAPVATVHGLVQDLALLVAFAWEDEEEALAPPGDYGAEESGW